MIPQLSKLKSHLRKKTSEPANKPPEALNSACSPPGLSRRNATSTRPIFSRSPPPQSPPLTSPKCKDTRCARHTSSQSPTPLSLPSTPRGRTVAPRASFRSPEQLNVPLRPRRILGLRQPTRTKTEQAGYIESLRDAEVEKAEESSRLIATDLARAEELVSRHTRSPYTIYVLNTAPPEPVRKRKPSLTQPTRKRAERVAAGDCMGRGCFSAFCVTSCAFDNGPKPAYSRPQFVTMSTNAEPDDEMATRPKTNSFWTSIKQIHSIDSTFSNSEKKRSFRRFILDLIDCLKVCGKLLLVAAGCTRVLH